jgi:hypothetical protein
MERFNYPNIAAVLCEDAAILRYLQLEALGDKRDQQEKIDAMEAEMESVRDEMRHG